MPNPIDESLLVQCLPAFRAYHYGHAASYPWPVPGVGTINAPGQYDDCCTFVESLCVRAFELGRPGFTWGHHRHDQMMVSDPKHPFSPVTAAIEAGIADEADAVGPWTLVQAWRQKWKGGHTFLVVDHDPATDRVLILESNKGFGLDGPGFRALGSLDKLDCRPPDWWNRAESWTWEKVVQTYPYRRMARLQVTGLTLSGR